MLTIDIAKTTQDLDAILALQTENHKELVPLKEQQCSGFVTVRHSFALLERMNKIAAHIVAKDQEKVVGYALVMTVASQDEIPVLKSMFQVFKTIRYKNRLLGEYKYYVMGQICIDSAYRGQGIFRKMYDMHKQLYGGEYDLCITEVSSLNTRSLQAHLAVDFENVHVYSDQEDTWHVLVLDLSEPID